MANKIDLNNASVEEISRIEGITNEMAKAIVEYRENKDGKIENLDELNGLNGIDFYLMENIRKASHMGL